MLAGACFGGWVAAEMAVRNTARFAGLLLAAPLGIKVGGVLDRDITDMHAISRARVHASGLGRSGERRDRLYRNCPTPNWPASRVGGRRWRCSAGSRTCTIPG